MCGCGSVALDGEELLGLELPVMTEMPVLMRASTCCLNRMNGFLDGGGSASDIMI